MIVAISSTRANHVSQSGLKPFGKLSGRVVRSLSQNSGIDEGQILYYRGKYTTVAHCSNVRSMLIGFDLMRRERFSLPWYMSVSEGEKLHAIVDEGQRDGGIEF